MGKFGAWTKVKDGLPEKERDGYQFLVTAYDPADKSLEVYATEYDIKNRWNEKKYWAIETIGIKVRAWMEFPDSLR